MGQECTSAQGCCSQMLGANEIVTASGKFHQSQSIEGRNTADQNVIEQRQRLSSQGIESRGSFGGRSINHHNYIVNNVNIMNGSDLAAVSSVRNGSSVDQLSSVPVNQSEVQEVNDMEMSDGSRYTGQISMSNQLKHGNGTQIWSDGAKYTGDWRFGKAEGKGTFYHANGDVFQGTFRGDRANGHGTYQHKNGQRYQGQWVDDMQQGIGTETLQDGSVYKGEFYGGKKHGTGLYNWIDGTTYSGEWRNNIIDGQGTYEWPDGRKYQGEWQNNKLHNRGVYTWPDGRRYDGEYNEDKKHGLGTYIWPDGKKYEGYWYQGKQHGQGRFTNTSGKSRIGVWVSGNRLKWLPSTITEIQNLDPEELIRQTDMQEIQEKTQSNVEATDRSRQPSEKEQLAKQQYQAEHGSFGAV